MDSATVAGLLDSELLEYWEEVREFADRDIVLREMKKRGLFPSEDQTRWENQTGAYPDIADPEFLQKLLSRREFAESLQRTWKRDPSPCEAGDEFEVTPVQKFVANFLSPRTPYRSALFYHGTGVGKTCAAIQVAEQWLSVFPYKKVIILAPRTIRRGFANEIFNINKVKISEGSVPNTSSQCTGTTYLEMAGVLYEKNPNIIKGRISELVKSRYEIIGYAQFAKRVKDELDKVSGHFVGEERDEEERRVLRAKFSGTLIIVDEAHNLRDVPQKKGEEEVDAPGGGKDKKEEKEGKILTPFFRKVLRYAEDMKLVLMTATPMYNSHEEIIFLFNLILMNEKKGTISSADIFADDDGNFKEGGAEMLAALARNYVSFMRGENPQIFPLRLDPIFQRMQGYPTLNPGGTAVGDHEFIKHMPIIPVPLQGDSLDAQVKLLDLVPPGDKINPFTLGPIVQAGTCIVPEVDGATVADRTSEGALRLHFTQQSVGGQVQFRAKVAGGARWLGLDRLPAYAPKIAAAIDRVQSAEGVCFIYSRFVRLGAIPIALALEANGYTPHRRSLGLLADGMQVPGGRQCALCPLKEGGHAADHDFVPARYILLTGSDDLSPRKDADIEDVRNFNNSDGGIIKVIVGSRVAEEGVDFRFIREIHILESWFHLNRTEQVVGRGIRTCSHIALPIEKRNCTVHLYANVFPDNAIETLDLFSYRYAYNKARRAGVITRLLKINAVDCNLNHDAILINNEDPVARIIDSQRNVRTNVDINDRPFTALCDWLETCDYKCNPEISVDPMRASEISFDEYKGRFMDSQIKKILRRLFEESAWWRDTDLRDMLSYIPAPALKTILRNVINNPSFKVAHGGKDGYIISRNKYYIFQPSMFRDPSIPIAMRVGSVPVRLDSYSPEFMAAATAAFGVAPTIRRRIADAPATMASEEVAAAAAESEAAPKTRFSAERLHDLFEELGAWAEGLATSDDGTVSNDVSMLVNSNDRIIMIRWFAQALRSAGVADLGPLLRKILTEIVFDEDISQDERLLFFLNPAFRDYGRRLAPEYFLQEGQNQVFATVSMASGEVIYLGPNGAPVEQTIRDIFDGKDEDMTDEEKRAINPSYGAVVNNKNTGFFYGFITVKRGLSFVFKTADPPTVGNKVKPGAECAIVSYMREHVENITNLGAVLTVALKDDFHLDDNIQKYMLSKDNKFHLEKEVVKKNPDVDTKSKAVNAARICTLTNLFLRFMDIKRVNGIRWFYRIIEAATSGHRGTYATSKAAAKKKATLKE